MVAVPVGPLTVVPPSFPPCVWVCLWFPWLRWVARPPPRSFSGSSAAVGFMAAVSKPLPGLAGSAVSAGAHVPPHTLPHAVLHCNHAAMCLRGACVRTILWVARACA